MKKFCLLLVCLLILPMFFVGCNKEDAFIEVQSITYSIGDETKTLESTFVLKYEISHEVPEEEYNNAQLFYVDFEHKKYLSSQTIDTDKNNLNTALAETITSGTYYLVSEYGDTFSKFIIHNEFDIKYVKVKIINDNIIEIQNYKNEISRIKTDNYQIKYFL